MQKRSGKNRTQHGHQEVERLLTQITTNVDTMRVSSVRDGEFHGAYRAFLVDSVQLYKTLDELYTCDPGAKAAYDGFIALHGTR